MEIIGLSDGQLAPSDTDCIKINAALDGTFTLVASALMACGDGDDDESFAMVGSDPYPSYEAAEAARLAWAEAHCVATVYIETGGELQLALRATLRRGGGPSEMDTSPDIGVKVGLYPWKWSCPASCSA